MKFFLIFFITLSAFPKSLNNVELFVRCYGQITNSFPSRSMQVFRDIQDGKKDALTECFKILDDTKIVTGNSGSEGNLTPVNETTLKVLKQFHRLHYSWFETKVFKEINDTYVRSASNIYDYSNPALYLTRALFDSNFVYSSILKGKSTYKAVRSNGRRKNALIRNVNVTHSAEEDVLQGVEYADTGDLLGIKISSSDLIYDTLVYDKDPRNNDDATRVPGGSVQINTHWGGGVIGSQVYMLQNVDGMGLGYKPDGGVRSNRKWSRAVLNDFLCRELPAIRDQDATAYVNQDSSLTYRKTKGCVKCHATMDPMASLNRNLRYTVKGRFFDPNGSYAFLTKVNIDRETKDYFPIHPDSEFYRRPAKGHFLYRTIQGNKVYKEISGLDELSNEIIKLDDYYICAAKKYFKYFTGIDADISDIQDPSNVKFLRLSEKEKSYREQVINLGKKFKTHQNPKELIKDILRTSQYKKSHYGLED